eukprot:TRINITY_DN12413_c0_g3_i2.p1 TRINITY_DN12413_c0_g3~~TRINITY_DN12413_c0_g3_i2.p1  ORF type:complete len:435 (-),score=87.03 TRINITY_DN12413_c0_g3_i2:308-1612(-)
MFGAPSQQTTFQVPADKTGLIIGKHGATVKKINSDYGVECNIPKKNQISGPTVTITIKGRDPAGAQQHIQALCNGAKPQNNSNSGWQNNSSGGQSTPTLAPLCKSSEPHGPSQQQGDTCPASVTGLLLCDGKLYSSGKDGQINVWSLDGASLNKVSAVACPGPAFSLLSEAGWLFAGMDGGVQCWNLGTGATQPLAHPSGPVLAMSVCQHPQAGGLLITGGADGSIKMWQLKQQWENVSTLQGHTRPIRSITVWTSNPSPLIVSASGGVDQQGSEVKVWQLENGQCLQTLTDHTHWVMSTVPMLLTAGPQPGNYLCTASLDTTIKVYTLGGAGFEGFHSHDITSAVAQPADVCRITAMILTQDPNGTHLLATALVGGVMILWDVPAGFTERCRLTEVSDPQGGNRGEVVVLSHVPGQMIMAGAGDGYIKIWRWS